MPKQKTGTRRVNLIVPANDDVGGVARGAEAAALHLQNVPKDDLTAKSWARPSPGEGLVMAAPVVVTRWTREGNVTVEVS
tara:strand:- start:163 stop:402 length:240 start_codon:yes stop_codon:yes gene_type:complete